MKLKDIGKKVLNWGTDNSPEILTGLTCGGVVGTAIMSGQASVKAYEILAQQEKELTWKDKIALTWKVYIPTGLMGLATVGCAIGSNRISSNRVAAISGLYALAEKGLTEYQNKVIETIGEKKERAIRDDIAKDRIDADPVSNKEVILTGNGDFLCYDVMSGRYFRSTIDKIKKVQNDMNHELLTEMWISLNDVYYELGLKGTKVGEYYGWTPDDQIYFTFSTQLADGGEPCLVMDYTAAPKPKHFN